MKNFFLKLYKPLLVLLCILAILTVIADNSIETKEDVKKTNQITVDQDGKVVGKNQNKVSASPTARVNDAKSGKATQKPTVTPSPTATPVEDKKVTIMAVGDDLVHIPVIDSGKQADGSYNYDHLFKNILKDIEEADISVINQETVLGGKHLGFFGYPRFNSPDEIGDAIRKAGFNVVLHATNHSMDKGEQGMQHAIDYWKQYKDITVLGVNETEKEYNTIRIVEVKGIKFAMLNYTYSLNGLPLPNGRPYMVNMLDEEKIRQDVAKAKKEADFVIVFPHWGTEYKYEPSRSQNRWTQVFLEAGVDLVIGTHPHVLEPVEWLEREDGHKMLVYYSLGNYVSAQSEYPRMLGGMAKVTLVSENGEKPTISEASITPLVTHFDRNYGNYEVLRLSKYTNQMASQHRIKEMSLSRLKNLAKQVLGDWYQEN